MSPAPIRFPGMLIGNEADHAPTDRFSSSLRRVVQLDGTGCGLACVAMLARRSYSDIRRSFSRVFPKKELNLGRYWTDAADLRKLLVRFRIELGREVRVRTWNKVPDFALVAVHWKRSKGTWHWVLFVRDQHGGFILDPRKSVVAARRRDLHKIRPASYHRIRVRGKPAS
jgi:hypothetical protein